MRFEVSAAQRILGSLAALIGFASAGFALNRVLAPLDPPGAAPDFSAIEHTRTALAPRARVPNSLRVVLLADSTMLHEDPREHGASRLWSALSARSRGRDSIEVVNMLLAGLDVFDYWALADQVVAAKPDQVVLAINLQSFDVRFPHNRRRAELAGMVSPRRIPEALFLPLRAFDVSPDRILLYVGLSQAGLEGISAQVRDAQARLDSAWKGYVESPSGSEVSAITRFRAAANRRRMNEKVSSNRRYTRAGVESLYGTALAGVRGDEPELVMLRAALARIASAGIPALAYVAPVNVEHFRALGVETDGLDRSTQRIGALVRNEGARFVDLHALLPDESFEDPVHFDRAGAENGIRAVARALSAEIVEQQRHASRSDRSKND